MSEWPDEARRDYERSRDARAEGARLLSDRENRWAAEVLDAYLDVKDFAHGTRLSDLSPAQAEAFRAIRQGSGGRLGSPPAL